MKWFVARISDRITPGKTINMNAATHNKTPELSATNKSLQKKTPTLGIVTVVSCSVTGSHCITVVTVVPLQVGTVSL